MRVVVLEIDQSLQVPNFDLSATVLGHEILFIKPASE